MLLLQQLADGFLMSVLIWSMQLYGFEVGTIIFILCLKELNHREVNLSYAL